MSLTNYAPGRPPVTVSAQGANYLPYITTATEYDYEKTRHQQSGKSTRPRISSHDGTQ